MLARERRNFARGETWDSRVEALMPRLDPVFPRVSSVIITYNNLMNRQCLESVFEGTSWPNLEVVVVDNASTDGTAEWLTKVAPAYSRLHVSLNAENRGFAAATRD